MNTTDHSALHNVAMELANEALALRRQAKHLFEQAFEHEAAAARCHADRHDYEPTRSVLYRSAATLACDCGKLDEAERLAHEGLAGNPPKGIAEELRSVLWRIQWLREEPKP